MKLKEDIMKELKKDLMAITKDLNGLIQKTEKLKKSLEEVEKDQTTQNTKKKAVRVTKKAVNKKAIKVTAKAKPITAIDTVSKIFTSSRSSKGIDVATLKKKTGFDEKKIWNIIYSLKKQGRIKGLRYGLYIKS